MQTASTAAVLNTKITIDQVADFIEESTINQTLDLGQTFIHRATHPTFGSIILVSSSGDEHAILSA